MRAGSFFSIPKPSKYCSPHRWKNGGRYFCNTGQRSRKSGEDCGQSAQRERFGRRTRFGACLKSDCGQPLLSESQRLKSIFVPLSAIHQLTIPGRERKPFAWSYPEYPIKHRWLRHRGNLRPKLTYQDLKICFWIV